MNENGLKAFLRVILPVVFIPYTIIIVFFTHEWARLGVVVLMVITWLNIRDKPVAEDAQSENSKTPE